MNYKIIYKEKKTGVVTANKIKVINNYMLAIQIRFWQVKYGGVAIKQGVCVCCFYRLCKLMHTEKPVFLEAKSGKL